MAAPGSDGEHAVANPTEHSIEKEDHSPTVHPVDETASFDIDAHDLPEGYFRKPAFLGTMLAVGLAMSGVRDPFLSNLEES
jgi:hypothetical protein